MWKGGIATPSPNTVFLKLPKRVCSSEWLKLGGRLSFFACLIVSGRLFFPLIPIICTTQSCKRLLVEILMPLCSCMEKFLCLHLKSKHQWTLEIQGTYVKVNINHLFTTRSPFLCIDSFLRYTYSHLVFSSEFFVEVALFNISSLQQ